MKQYPRSSLFVLGTTIVGVLLIVFPFLFSSGGIAPNTLQVFGLGLFLMGVVRGVRLHRIRRIPEKQREFEIQQTDERLQFLRQKAISWTFWISIFAELIAGLVLQNMLSDSLLTEFGTWICMFVCVQILLYAALYIIFSRKF